MAAFFAYKPTIEDFGAWIAFGCAAAVWLIVGLYLKQIWGCISNRMKERRWHLLVACWVEGWKCPLVKIETPSPLSRHPQVPLSCIGLVRFSSSFLSTRHAQRHLRLGVTAAGRLCLFGVRFSHWTIA
jgi:hypothetical protein